MTLRPAALALVLLLACPLPSFGQGAPVPSTIQPVAPVSPAASAPPAHLIVNETDLAAQTAPVVVNGVLMLPADPVAKAFGATTSWNAAAQTLTATGMSGTVVRLVAGQARVQVDGAWRDLPAAATLREGILWAPGAALLRALGAYVVDTGEGTQQALAQVTNVAWRADGDALAVRVSATGPVHTDAHLLRLPDRLVVDLGGAITRLSTTPEDIGVAGVARLRAAQFHVRPFITRLVFDLDHPVKFTVAAESGGVALAFGDAAAAAHPAAPSAPAAQIAPPHTLSPGPTTPAATPTPAVPSSPAGPAAAAGPSAPPKPEGPAAQAPSATPAPAEHPAPSASAAPSAPAPVAAQPSPDASGPAPEPMALPPLPDFADHPGAFHVQTVTYDDQGHAGRITIHASEHLTYALHAFVYPDRLAIDIAGGVYRERRRDIEVDSEAVRNIVVAQFLLKPNLTRVLVHLYRRLPYSAVVTDGGRTLVVTLGDPGRRVARGSAVIIDPGHGGADGGAVGPSGLRESDVTLAISKLVRDDLTGQGIAVAMTRTADTAVPLEERPDLAVRNGGILFVSIHANASASIGPAGTETYYKTPESAALARVVQSEVAQALGEPDRGVKTADFYVLVNTPMPAVLVETLFISNPAEEAMLRDPAVQRRIADAIARAIEKYLAAKRAPAAP